VYIFVCNNHLTGFADACLLDKGEPIAEINETEEEQEDESLRRRKRKSSAVYRLSSNVLLCVCSPHLDIAQSFDFTEKVCLTVKIYSTEIKIAIKQIHCFILLLWKFLNVNGSCFAMFVHMYVYDKYILQYMISVILDSANKGKVEVPHH
jgi:hypothetical protein